MEDVLRLTFEYRDGQFVALAPKQVRMVAPEDVSPDESEGGHFVELRSADGETLQYRSVPSETIPMAEFPTGDPERPFGRTIAPPGSIVSVLVPFDDRATEAALVEISSDRTRGLQERKRDLAIVPLAQELPQ